MIEANGTFNKNEGMKIKTIANNDYAIEFEKPISIDILQNSEKNTQEQINKGFEQNRKNKYIKTIFNELRIRSL